eukprot:2194313-Prymnesium_polylepis.1
MCACAAYKWICAQIRWEEAEVNRRMKRAHVAVLDGEVSEAIMAMCRVVGRGSLRSRSRRRGLPGWRRSPTRR